MKQPLLLRLAQRASVDESEEPHNVEIIVPSMEILAKPFFKDRKRSKVWVWIVQITCLAFDVLKGTIFWNTAKPTSWLSEEAMYGRWRHVRPSLNQCAHLTPISWRLNETSFVMCQPGMVEAV